MPCPCSASWHRPMSGTSWRWYAANTDSADGLACPVISGKLSRKCGLRSRRRFFNMGSSPFSLLRVQVEGRQLRSNLTMFRLTTTVIIAIAMADLAVAQHYGAMMDLEQGMSPRYFLGSPRPAKRDLNCGTGYHHCKLAFNGFLYDS
jgi:hypothetical protein